MANYKPNLTIEDALPLAIQFVPKAELEQAFRDPKKYLELSQEIFDLAENLFVDFNTYFTDEEELALPEASSLSDKVRDF